MTVAAAPPTTSPPLWAGQNLEIIGLTGDFASGKTLFGLTIDPAHTLAYDTEKSSSAYLSLGFDRYDIADEMLNAYHGGYKPIDVYQRWLSSVRAIRPGQYRVIMLDTVSEIESGLCDWVHAHPQEFGHTAGQYQRMQGLFWGDVKQQWKAVLSDLSARCETFVFTSHLRTVWQGDRPVPGKKAPKGKETLMELASLYLYLRRDADEKGRRPAKPSAVVLKSRLAHAAIGADGEIEIKPILPPHLPEATPQAIRKYIEQPADYGKLKANERWVDPGLSADDRLILETQKAEAIATAAVASAGKPSVAELIQRAAPQQQPSDPPAVDTVAPAEQPPFDAPTAETNGYATPGQLESLRKVIEALAVPLETQRAWLARVGVNSYRSLTSQQAGVLLEKLRRAEMGFSGVKVGPELPAGN